MTARSPEVVVVTGAGSGIGAALARRAAREGAAAVIVTDRNGDAADDVAAEIGSTALARKLDVTDADAVADLAQDLITRFHHVDVVFSNAGITSGIGVLGGDDTQASWLWETAWEVNIRAHVHLARAFLPTMISGGGGRFVVTASAAGLLTSPGDCPYAVTKHAAVAFAEWLSIHHGHQGIDVSVICPQGVATPLLASPISIGQTMEDVVRHAGDILSSEDVADIVWQAIGDREFLILPHPEVAEFVRQKAFDTDNWIVRMRRFIQRC
jgi:NAD(P)-dependent dehydrogenase (short-subunit alcohol dehydrogenase family)